MSAATLGPNARRVLAMSIGGRKRKAVLLAVAMYADAGRNDPSIGELARRAKLDRNVVISVIERHERDGLLEVRRALGQRNVYSFPDPKART